RPAKFMLHGSLASMLNVSSAMSSDGDRSIAPAKTLLLSVIGLVLIIKILFLVAIWLRRSRHSGSNVTPDTQSLTINKFLNAMELENPIRFTSQQLSIATDNFTHLLVSGGSGALYKLQRDFWQQNQCVSEDFTWKLGLRTVHQKGPSF
ncbi:hypothetical protein CISIN_1g0228581mg, partial [Citrus sinensis]